MTTAEQRPPTPRRSRSVERSGIGDDGDAWRPVVAATQLWTAQLHAPVTLASSSSAASSCATPLPDCASPVLVRASAMPSLSTLFYATRPWAFPVTVCAIAIGGSLAYVDSPARFSWPFFLLSLLGALLVHAAANLINTYGDYTQGVDVKASADDRAIVDGLLTAEHVYRLIVFCVSCALAIVAVICYAMTTRRPPALEGRTYSTPVLDFLALSAAGLFIGYAYTAPPFYWKYKGLGDVCIILGYGPLLVAGGYYCQLSALPSLPALFFSLVPGLGTEAILHANNTRDQAWDAQCGAVTLPMKLGQRLSGLYFIALFAVQFAICIAAALDPAAFLPRGASMREGEAEEWWRRALFLLPLLLLPNAVDLVRRYYAGSFKDLCPRCGELCGKNGVLLSIAIVVWGATAHYPQLQQHTGKA